MLIYTAWQLGPALELCLGLVGEIVGEGEQSHYLVLTNALLFSGACC